MNKAKNLAPGIAIVMVLMLATAAALLATPVLAGPNSPKFVAPLEDANDVRYGQAIFNTNFEDEYDGYELEVEVEECMALADSTVTVYLDGGVNGVAVSTNLNGYVGTIEVDEFGNGKETFYVDAISESSIVTVESGLTLTGDTWHLWEKGPGPK